MANKLRYKRGELLFIYGSGGRYAVTKDGTFWRAYFDCYSYDFFATVVDKDNMNSNYYRFDVRAAHTMSLGELFGKEKE